MGKHTPEPWKISPHDRWDKEYYIEGNTDYGNVIAVIDNDDVNQDEQWANALLIKAAPDLLAACEALLQYIGEAQKTRTLTQVAKMAEEAIAKAKRDDNG